MDYRTLHREEHVVCWQIARRKSTTPSKRNVATLDENIRRSNETYASGATAAARCSAAAATSARHCSHHRHWRTSTTPRPCRARARAKGKGEVTFLGRLTLPLHSC
jgi:hypothetical protein